MSDTQQTIPEIIKEVQIKMCDEYCKYPLEYEGNEMLEVICEKCPLGRLG